MCGITGYLGGREACPILIDGLRQLEYRGYDSAGIALVDECGELHVYKEKGKVQDLEAGLAGKNISGHLGIAHTRWATPWHAGHHGMPVSLGSR